MHNKTEIRRGLKKAMEFYNELGFQYMPFSRKEMAAYLTKAPVSDEQRTSGLDGQVQASMNKDEALKDLREEIGDCQRCQLCKKRNNIVFGDGSPDAGIMFIGEGPGREEDNQARPFVGDAGKLLTSLIVKLGMKREDVYIANIVKCRPPGNRNPEEDEIMTCRPFVERQVEIISPRVIVCLGKIATQALLRMKTPISRVRGAFQRFGDVPVMPTFHPAYLLRNPKDKWLTWDDMQKVMEKVKDNR